MNILSHDILLEFLHPLEIKIGELEMKIADDDYNLTKEYMINKGYSLNKASECAKKEVAKTKAELSAAQKAYRRGIMYRDDLEN
jgi:hypothetical protein